MTDEKKGTDLTRLMAEEMAKFIEENKEVILNRVNARLKKESQTPAQQ